MPRSELPTSGTLSAVAFPFGAPPQPSTRPVAAEVAVAVQYGGQPYAVMMASPADLGDFAYGFSLTEGVVRGAADVLRVDEHLRVGGVELDVTLAPGVAPPRPRERSTEGRTGCGVCGVTSLAQLPVAPVQRRPPAPVSLAAVRRALTALDALQPLHALTRAVHAAAWCAADGAVATLREDVGRHCALDKLVGARLRAGEPAGDGFVVLTSRCSFELVEKAAAYGARTVVTISAPTTFAVERARLHDVTLLAVARHDGLLAFHGAERVVD